MSGSHASSSSSNRGCPLVGEDSSDGSSQYSSGSSNTDGGGVPPSQAPRSAAYGSLQDASLAGRGKRMDQGRARSNYFAIPNTYRSGSSSSKSSEDEEMPGVGVAAPTGGQGMGIETLPHCHRHGLQTSLPHTPTLRISLSYPSMFRLISPGTGWHTSYSYTGRTPNGWSFPMTQSTLKLGYQ